MWAESVFETYCRMSVPEHSIIPLENLMKCSHRTGTHFLFLYNMNRKYNIIPDQFNWLYNLLLKPTVITQGSERPVRHKNKRAI